MRGVAAIIIVVVRMVDSNNGPRQRVGVMVDTEPVLNTIQRDDVELDAKNARNRHVRHGDAFRSFLDAGANTPPPNGKLVLRSCVSNLCGQFAAKYGSFGHLAEGRLVDRVFLCMVF